MTVVSESGLIAASLGTAVLLVGVWLLRRSWLAGRDGGKAALYAGWLGLILGSYCFVLGFGVERGITFALLIVSPVAYLWVGLAVRIRGSRANGRAREAALAPDQRAATWTRTILASLLAIVLAGVAAIGLGVAFAVAMPMSPIERIVIGGLLVPILWGGGMAWVLADAKLGRAALILLAVSALGYGVAFAPKMHLS